VSGDIICRSQDELDAARERLLAEQNARTGSRKKYCKPADFIIEAEGGVTDISMMTAQHLFLDARKAALLTHHLEQAIKAASVLNAYFVAVFFAEDDL
jgi:hypothetical protein